MASTGAEHPNAVRLAALQAKLKARTDHTGKARPGYSRNVIELRAEIASLEKP